MSQEALKELAMRRREIGGEALSVAMYLIGTANFNNEVMVISQTDIADAIGMHKSRVSRCIKTLVKEGILIETEKKKTYKISAEIAWKGEAKNHVASLSEERIKRLMKRGSE